MDHETFPPFEPLSSVGLSNAHLEDLTPDGEYPRPWISMIRFGWQCKAPKVDSRIGFKGESCWNLFATAVFDCESVTNPLLRRLTDHSPSSQRST